MGAKPFFVNAFGIAFHGFSTTFFSRVSNRLQGRDGELPVDKTAAGGPVFAILGRVRRLVIRPGALGDFVVSLPALECLKSEYLEVWTASAHVPLV